MGLGWQRGPLGATQGRFLTAQPLPERLLFAEPLGRRMRVKLEGKWIADSENVMLLHEPGKYPVAYFPVESVLMGTLTLEKDRTTHNELGDTAWFKVSAGERWVSRAAWQHVALPSFADLLHNHVAFVWHAMDGFYEEDERVVGHATDPYHRIDIRKSSRHLVVKSGDEVIAETRRPLVLYESGYGPRWYVPREDVNDSLLQPVVKQTFCPYKGIANYYDIGDASAAAWSYKQAWAEAALVSDLVSFEPDKVDVFIDGKPLGFKAAQSVALYGHDRRLHIEEIVHQPVDTPYAY